MDLPQQLIRLFEQFKVYNIFLIEWEHTLFRRLGYPLTLNIDMFFLVPDDQLDTLLKLAADLGYYPSNNEKLCPRYTSELSAYGIRYIIQQPNEGSNHTSFPTRLGFFPLSWTGISRHEATHLDAFEFDLSCTIYTVPVSVACTALVRIASREERGSSLHSGVIAHLACIIGYHFFDISYEGDYYQGIPDDQPWSEKEVLEMNTTVRKLEGWEMKEGEEWIRRELIRAVTGKISYGDLPAL